MIIYRQISHSLRCIYKRTGLNTSTIRMKNYLSKYKLLRRSVSVSKEIWIVVLHVNKQIDSCVNMNNCNVQINDYIYFVVLWKSLPQSKQIGLRLGLTPLSTIFQLRVYRGGNGRKPPTCRKSLTNLIT